MNFDNEEDLAAFLAALRSVGYAITPPAAGNNDATGGYVSSLTEALMGATAGLVQIANAIDGLAEAVRERNSP